MDLIHCQKLMNVNCPFYRPDLSIVAIHKYFCNESCIHSVIRSVMGLLIYSFIQSLFSCFIISLSDYFAISLFRYFTISLLHCFIYFL